jgi:hypothetical protein
MDEGTEEDHPPASGNGPAEEDDDRESVLVMAAKLNRAAEDLKGELSIDEAAFRVAAPQAHGSSRDYFVFEALDEIQKAVVSVFQCHELVSDEPPDPGEGFTRVVAESVADESALRQRKLIETLADLIGFVATPQEGHYRDCLLHAQLDGLLAAQRDLLREYGAESRNLAHQIGELAAEIEGLEAVGLDPTLAWYRRRAAAFELSRMRPGMVMASFAWRFDHAVPLASDTERAALGFSYSQGFGRRSDKLHARPGPLESTVDMLAAAAGLNATIAIALPVLVRCQKTIDGVPAGENRWLRDIDGENDLPGRFRRKDMRGTAVVGDIVMAAGELAQVTEIAEGRNGYRSYLVRYLSDPPLPEIPEDWHVAQQVKVVIDRRRARAMVSAQAAARPGRGIEKLLELEDERLLGAIGESIAAGEAAGAGMRDAILAQPRRRGADREDSGRSN